MPPELTLTVARTPPPGPPPPTVPPLLTATPPLPSAAPEALVASNTPVPLTIVRAEKLLAWLSVALPLVTVRLAVLERALVTVSSGCRR